jgi:hypothetical protein
MKYKLFLKCELRYKLTSNINVADGLAKSAMGKLKRIDFDVETNKPAIVWLQFDYPNVGLAAKQSCIEFMKEKNIPLDYVPIKLHTETITDAQKIKIKIHHEAIRKQFPIILCEACTYHGVQGLGIPCLCMDSRFRELATALAYVGLSRCDYSGLYLMGKIPYPKPRQQNLINEVYRLRNAAQLELSFYNFEQDLGVKIIYHNINSYKSHGVDILAINWYWKADIIILSEANVFDSEQVKVRNDFRVVFPSEKKLINQTNQKRSMGLIIICKNSCNIKKLSNPNIITNTQNTYHIDLRSFEVENNFIITGYCSPKAPLHSIKVEFLRLLNNKPNDYQVTLMGDLNNDWKRLQNSSFYKLLAENNFNNLLNDSITNNAGSQIDIVFSTSKNSYAGTFASYFSDHFAIFYQSCIDPKKLCPKDKEYFLNLRKEPTFNIQYSVIPPDEIKTGIMGNVLFKSERIYSDGNGEEIKFLNLSTFNAVFSSFFALYKYTEVFQSIAQALELNYPFFKFILETEKNAYNLQVNISEEWIKFLLENFPKIRDNIVNNSINMSRDFSYVITNLLTNWEILGEKVDHRWASFKRNIVKCTTPQCINFSNFMRETMIQLNITKFELISNLENNIESFVLSRPNLCVKCKNPIETKSSMIVYSPLIIININITNENFTKISIDQIPMKIVLNNINYELKIILCEINNHPNAFYRIIGRDFLQMDDEVDFELVIKYCKELVELKALIYIKSEESLIADYNKTINTNKTNNNLIVKKENTKPLIKKNILDKKEIKLVENVKEPISDSKLEGKNSEGISSKSKIDPAIEFKINLKNKFNFKEATLGDVPFPNSFNVKIRFNNDQFTVNFFNMCPYNSIFSAFHSLLNHTEIFRESEQFLKDNFPLFNFILITKENFNGTYSERRDQSWIDFISGFEKNKIDNKLKTIKDKTKQIKVNMEGDVGPIVNELFEFYQEENLFACIKNSVKCDTINCSGFSERDKNLILNLFISKANLKCNIESEIKETLKATNYCIVCRKSLEPNISFNECIILNVNVQNEANYGNLTDYEILQDQENNTKINIREIQKYIVNNNIVYELKAIIDHSPGHFKSYYRINNDDYLEMDDLVYLGKEWVHKNLSLEINPKVLIYIKTNDNISNLPSKNNEIFNNSDSNKVKYNEEDFMVSDIEDNEPMDLEYEEDNFDDNQEICKNNALIPNTILIKSTNQSYSSLCPYNSILNGFVATYKFNPNFANFVNSNKLQLFEIIKKLIREKNQEKRNEIWIKFLYNLLTIENNFSEGPGDHYPFKLINNNSYSMVWDVQNFYDALVLKNNKLHSYCYRLTCECGYRKEVNCGIISVRSQPKTEFLLNSLNNLDLVIKEKLRKTCSKCNGVLNAEILFYKVLMIYTSFNIIQNEKIEIPLSDIPLLIEKNNSSYSFKFLVNFINNNNPTINHFDCYAYNYNSKKFSHIDDLGQTENEISQPLSVNINPKIIFYFKN